MLRYVHLLVFLLVSLAGCATYPDLNRERLATLPHSYANFDAHLAWEYRDTGKNLVIDGEFKNRRYAYMEDVEVWVAVLNPAGKTEARAVGFVIPQVLKMDEIAPFTVKLPRQSPGTRLRFTYKYRGREGGTEGEGAAVWMQNFDATVPPL